MSFFAQRRLFLFGLLAAPAVIEATKASAADSPSRATDKPLYVQDFAAFENKTLEQKFQELADREEIRELIARYAHRIAEGLPIANLFTDDARFLIRMPGKPVRETRGRAEMDKIHPGGVPHANHVMPMIHNHLLVISGNEASGVCFNELRSVAEDGKSSITTGVYNDRFRREKGNWKFTLRDFTLSHQLAG